MIRMLSLIIFFSVALAGHAFAPPRVRQSREGQSFVETGMVPKYINEKWVAQSEAEMSGAGYDVVGTLIRHGPLPACRRIFQPDDYEQAVLKFMASEKCDCNTAQGNMDAYMRNPNDWFASRLKDESRGYKVDYVTINPIEVALVSVWGTAVSIWAGRIICAWTVGVEIVRSFRAAARVCVCARAFVYLFSKY